jgi:hypothetical protein
MLHCWKDKREHVEETEGWGTDAYWATYSDEGANRNGTCMREAEHVGPHNFTPDDQIRIAVAATN